ncbi:MAG: hypothetical protein WCW27_01045 [Patescibacteria group bacterium]|jgi:hypothetical protein
MLANIEINALQSLLGVAVILIGLGMAWGSLRNEVRGIKKTLDEEVKPDLKNVRERFAALEARFVILEDRVDTLWQDQLAPVGSPRQLNERGKTILHESGIKEIVEQHQGQLLQLIKDQHLTNAYDTEQAINDVMQNLLKHFPELTDQLKNGAFSVGANMDEVLFVGAIYLRNLIFKDLGFTIDDINQLNKSK